MSLLDFLAAAGFWQWVGTIILASLTVGFAAALSQWRIFTFTIHKHYTKDEE